MGARPRGSRRHRRRRDHRDRRARELRPRARVPRRSTTRSGSASRRCRCRPAPTRRSWCSASGDSAAALTPIVSDVGDGARYLRTDESCETLWADGDDQPQYVVYRGPYDSEAEPCRDSLDGGAGTVTNLSAGNEHVRAVRVRPADRRAARHRPARRSWPRARHRRRCRGCSCSKQMLADLEGPDPEITGVYDDATIDRVRDFQRNRLDPPRGREGRECAPGVRCATSSARRTTSEGPRHRGGRVAHRRRGKSGTWESTSAHPAWLPAATVSQAPSSRWANHRVLKTSQLDGGVEPSTDWQPVTTALTSTTNQGTSQASTSSDRSGGISASAPTSWVYAGSHRLRGGSQPRPPHRTYVLPGPSSHSSSFMTTSRPARSTSTMSVAGSLTMHSGAPLVLTVPLSRTRILGRGGHADPRADPAPRPPSGHLHIDSNTRGGRPDGGSAQPDHARIARCARVRADGCLAVPGRTRPSRCRTQ